MRIDNRLDLRLASPNGPQLVPANQWHRLRLTYDGNGLLQMFIDGTLAVSQTATLNNRANDWTLTLGNFDGESTRCA